jgi:hypothetical protein
MISALGGDEPNAIEVARKRRYKRFGRECLFLADADDFVLCNKSSGIWGTPVVPLTQSGRQPVTQSRH